MLGLIQCVHVAEVPSGQAVLPSSGRERPI